LSMEAHRDVSMDECRLELPVLLHGPGSRAQRDVLAVLARARRVFARARRAGADLVESAAAIDALAVNVLARSAALFCAVLAAARFSAAQLDQCALEAE